MSVTISNFAGSDPLPQAVLKQLTDRLYEKRKTAALDVEKIIREHLNNNNHTEIAKIVRFLSQTYVLSQNQNNKKGGLIGLASSAIALGKDASKYRNDLVPCVLSCFSDPDSRVRYYACEALYNIVKVLKGPVLIYFNELFDGLSKLCCDADSNVRNGAELLDRLLKDTVMENSANEKFDLNVFMHLLRERIYVKNSFVRQFLVSWVKVLDSEPNLNMANYIHELLDGLFQILDDSNLEVKKMCESLLGELLREILSLPKDKIKFDEMINVILTHSANNTDDLMQYTAMMWLKELCNLQGDASLAYMPGILYVILPCLAYGDENSKKSIRELGRQINANLWTLVDRLDEQASSQNADEKRKNFLCLDKVIESLMKHFNVPNDAQNVSITYESLKWLCHLVNKQPRGMLAHVDEFFPILIAFLSNSSKEVVELDLQILANISSSVYLKDDSMDLDKSSTKYNRYFSRFMAELLELFRRDVNMRYEKGFMIIKELCILINAQDIYTMFSEILLNEQDAEFTLEMVDILNSILLTSTELYELRNLLKEFNTERSFTLFKCLYKTWSHNPIATVSLCLLSQNYEHAYNLINLFENLEINLSLLTAIDKLVQLIESPIFTYLRLHLLDFNKNQYLVRALYGLLMLLPQSEAFITLKQRLDCVPNYFNKVAFNQDVAIVPKRDNVQIMSSEQMSIDFQNLLKHFIAIQEKQKFFKKTKYMSNYNGTATATTTATIQQTSPQLAANQSANSS